jgi:hypothetical protein
MHFEYDKTHNFTLKYDSSDGNTSLEMNFDALQLQDVFDSFRNFLQGCGYVIDGYIDVMPWDTTDIDTSHNAQFDFTNIPKNNWPFGQNESVSQSLTQASEK